MATKRKKSSYGDMEMEELEQAHHDLREEIEDLREGQREIKREISSRASEGRVSEIVDSLTPEEREALAQEIGSAGGIKSQERVGNKKR